MILKGARVALGPRRAERLDVTVRRARVVSLGKAESGIDVRGCLILPGLINAHDHLSFNLFPRLGQPPYANATEWANDVYRPDESPVREHRSVPRKVRIAWGALKNLVSGVTTVAHHDPDPASMLRGLPIRVAKSAWAHSIQFTPDLARRFDAGGPLVIHAGEGTDAASRDEIFRLDAMGVLSDRTVVVHGVAFNAGGWELIERHKAALIACPVSNLYTLGCTLKRSVFSTKIPIALGTDSAITASGDLLDALRAAQSAWRLSADRLYAMVTTTAAEILQLRDGQGEIREGGVADLLVIRDPGCSPAEALMEVRAPKMVIVGGKIKLASARFAAPRLDSFSVRGRGRFFVDVPVSRLYQEATARLGGTLRLAGRRVRIK